MTSTLKDLENQVADEAITISRATLAYLKHAVEHKTPMANCDYCSKEMKA